MSNPTRFHGHARLCLDNDVRVHAAKLLEDAEARATFFNLLASVRATSTLLRPDGTPRTTAVRALFHLARHHASFRDEAVSWAGGDGDVPTLIRSLAHHLLARYPAPRFMTSVWLGDDTPATWDEQRWWIAHAEGRPFRDVEGLPLCLTRRMEDILLASPPQLPLRAAMRRAEILGLDGPPELVHAILATDLKADFDHAEFWRSVLHWFIHHWAEVGQARVGPIVDFLYANRIRGFEHAEDGVTLLPPPEPKFSIKGRTPSSLQRLVDAWHYRLALLARPTPQPRPRPNPSWKASGIGELHFVEPPREDADEVRWEIKELLCRDDLQLEGRALRHCVASYEWRCRQGTSSIWSLRRQAGDGQPTPQCTIEVEPQSRRVVQIRGYRNAAVSGLPQRLIATWARQERLDVGMHA